MLASIHPLGERSRRNQWWLTVVAHIAGSTAGGALVGALAGGVGALALRGTGVEVRWTVAAVLCAVGLALDMRVAGLRLPSVRRQVSEDWLTRYRGWVYGAGFGFQLGLAVVTTVVTAAVYLMLGFAFLSGSLAAGGLIGSAFGLARGLTVLVGAPVHDPARLRELHRRLSAGEALSARLAAAVQGAVLVAAGAMVVR